MVFDMGKRGSAASQVIGPIVMEVKGGPVVDEPELILGNEQVDIARGTVNIGHVGIKPNNGRSQLRLRRLEQHIISEGIGQIPQRQIQAGAGPE